MAPPENMVHNTFGNQNNYNPNQNDSQLMSNNNSMKMNSLEDQSLRNNLNPNNKPHYEKNNY